MGFIIIPGIDISDADAALADVLNPRTFYSVATPRKTGTMPTVALNPASNAYPTGYHVGAANLQTIEPDLIAANIVSGITIFGIAGTHGYFDRSYGATLGLVDAQNVIAAPDHTHNENAPLVTVYKQASGDAPADYISRRLATLGLVDAQSVHAGPDRSNNENAPLRAALSILCDGFVEETAAAVQTDKTAQARDATANDLNLCPMSDTVLDKIYVGSNYPFWQAQFLVGTVGAGNWTDVTYYWNGAWVAVVGEIDGTSSFLHAPAGLKTITHTPQGDWALSVIQGMNLYWLMIRTDNFVNRITKPLGSQVWVAI